MRTGSLSLSVASDQEADKVSPLSHARASPSLGRHGWLLRTSCLEPADVVDLALADGSPNSIVVLLLQMAAGLVVRVLSLTRSCRGRVLIPDTLSSDGHRQQMGASPLELAGAACIPSRPSLTAQPSLSLSGARRFWSRPPCPSSSSSPSWRSPSFASPLATSLASSSFQGTSPLLLDRQKERERIQS